MDEKKKTEKKVATENTVISGRTITSLERVASTLANIKNVEKPATAPVEITTVYPSAF